MTTASKCRVPFAVASSQVLHTNQGDIAGSRSGRSSRFIPRLPATHADVPRVPCALYRPQHSCRPAHISRCAAAGERLDRVRLCRALRKLPPGGVSGALGRCEGAERGLLAMGKTVVLAGALDTKGAEFSYVRKVIRRAGLDVLTVDFGVLGEPAFIPDISRAEVAQAGGGDLERWRSGEHKDEAMAGMAAALAVVVRRLFDEGRLDGIFSMGGSGGTSVATTAMRTLPVGVPKLVASTVGGGDVSGYAGTKDITFMPSVVDIAGFNRISQRIYANAAAAIAGMVAAEPPAAEQATMIAASMFGNTTAAEDLVRDGYFQGVLDLTTTELADEVCGGVMSAGPDRGRAAPASGVPVVLVPGCVDMANFGAPQTVPARYAGRHLYNWNPNVTLLRTNAAENTRIGEMLAAAANAATGPVAVLLPLRGVSMLDSPGGQFWDPAADRACYEAIRAHLKPSVPVEEVDANINDEAFAQRAADLLLAMIRETSQQRK